MTTRVYVASCRLTALGQCREKGARRCRYQTAVMDVDRQCRQNGTVARECSVYPRQRR